MLFVAVSITPVLIISYLSFAASTSAIEKQTFDHLTALREAKKDQIERYIDQLRHQTNTLSESTMTIGAMRELSYGFHNIENELDLTDEDFVRYNSSLRDYYQNELLTRLNPNLDVVKTPDDYWPTYRKTIIQQYRYIADNPNPTGKKEDMVTRPEGTSYDVAHAKYSPIFKSYVHKFGFYDIFLVDMQGFIVLTDFKEVDFSTNLLDGRYKDTSLGKAFRAALATEDHNFVYLSDFEPYDPSYADAASFIGTAIFDGDEKIGVLLFQTPVNEINRVMTSGEKWSETGFGRTGETYIIGQDYKMRSVSRFLIQDKDGYLKLASNSGTSDDTIGKIEKLDTTILLQEVRNPATEDALSGNSGNRIVRDYRGIDVLNAYTPLDIPDVNWAIIAKIDKSEAFSSINQLAFNSAMIGLTACFIVIVISFLVSSSVSRPIVKLKDTANDIARGKMNTKMSVFRKDEIGDLARSLDDMRYSLRMMIEEYEKDKNRGRQKTGANDAG
ncbi:MAG: HAMP domain-containing protein [Candidatus Aenigmarchaeota archaeon]|nr:HAMP domain-containing protein [Candidatus Aenigmarchaeota archaeon]